MTVGLEEQVKCVKREIAVRQRVYPRWVADGRMTEAGAKRELAAMEAVLVTVEAAASGARLF